MQPNIVFLDEYSLGDADLGSIRALGNYTGYRTTAREEVADRCREAAQTEKTLKSAYDQYQNVLRGHALEQLAGMQKLNIRFTDIRPGFVATPLLSGDGRYPMLMRTEKVAARIMHVLRHPRRRVVIDRRYALMVFFWKLIPEWLWERLNIRKDD